MGRLREYFKDWLDRGYLPRPSMIPVFGIKVHKSNKPLDHQLLQDMHQWCHANLGDRWIYMDEGLWVFDEPKDATMFKLTWG